MNDFLVAISGWSGDGAAVVGGVVLAMAIMLVILSVALIAAVLMQSSKDHNLSGAIAGGAETFFGKSKGNSMDKLLSKLTIVFSIVFAVIVVAMYVLVNWNTL